jgi:GAF domain-containing protein
MNPRELTACAEAAMMTAKARGKDRVVRFAEDDLTRPDAQRSLRTLAHMKLLQSLSTKLNRLNDLPRVGEIIAEELHGLIDYHNCRVFVVEGEDVVPIAFRGDLAASGPTRLDALRVKVGEGITGHVAATGRTLLLGDAAASALALEVPGTDRIEESVIAAPLLYGARVTGVILISKLGLDQLDEDDARLVEVLSGHAAIALENAQLYEAQRREAESATALLEFGRALAGARTLDEALCRIVERSAEVLGSARTSVWVQDPATGELVGRAEHGHDAQGRELVSSSRFPAAVADRFLARDTPFVLAREALLGIDGLPPQDTAFAIAPFELEDGRRGCIAAAVEAGCDAGERDLRLLAGLAYQARLAIWNADSFHGLEQTFLATLEALASTLGGRGVPSAAAARAVADLALAVGRRLGLDDPGLRRLELAALFHDVGTIGVPEAVLAKRGRLSAAERRLVERHAELGERIVAPVDRLRGVARAVRHCHEWWDGRGYPDGKAGNDVPLESRIIHVCAAFHAMTSERPYRERLSRAQAHDRLEAGSGTQFDPAIVEVFLGLPAAAPLP